MRYPLIVFDSRTGNVRRFVKKLGLKSVYLREVDKVNEKFVLVTFTDKVGEVPETTQKFLENNGDLLIGVASSGNRRWKNTFAIAADIISEQFNVPIISKFELAGNIETVQKFMERMNEIVDSGREHELLRA